MSHELPYMKIRQIIYHKAGCGEQEERKMSIMSEKKRRAKQRYGLYSRYCSYADRNSCRIQKIWLQATHQTLSLLLPHGNDNRIFIEWVRGRLASFLAQMIQCIPPDTVTVGQRGSSSLQLHHPTFPISSLFTVAVC